jgi:DnaJ-class molecular chaperone
MPRVEKVYYKETCEHCEGSGSEPGHKYYVNCSWCLGKGFEIVEEWKEFDQLDYLDHIKKFLG